MLKVWKLQMQKEDIFEADRGIKIREGLSSIKEYPGTILCDKTQDMGLARVDKRTFILYIERICRKEYIPGKSVLIMLKQSIEL
jgi:hypothetical protein